MNNTDSINMLFKDDRPSTKLNESFIMSKTEEEVKVS